MKRNILIGLFIITALLAIPAAAIGANGITVIVDRHRWFYNASESPLARLHDATVYPCDGSGPVGYYVWPHGDDIWVDMGFDIARVEYTWHYGTGGGPDFSGTAYGSCGGKVIIPNVLLYTSTTGFFTNDGGGLVNTCTIVSDLPASVERITALCGSTPEDIQLECAGPVKKLNMADIKGSWQCDPDLHILGEARLPLFDPEGGTGLGTLYHVYQRHLQHTQ